MAIVTCEPTNAALLAGGEWKPHKIQGWTPDFIPAVLDRKIYDRILPVSDEEAIATARAIAHQEGMFVGISAGATFAAALQVARAASAGSVILAMLPDTGERYLSTPLFRDVPAEMTEEEAKIFQSTPYGLS